MSDMQVKLGRTTITLKALTRPHVIAVTGKQQDNKELEALKPAPVGGYTHQAAMENISGYKDQWLAYENALSNARIWALLCEAWDWALENRDVADEESEREAFKQFCQKHDIPEFGDDPIKRGMAIYMAINIFGKPDELSTVLDWIMKEAGLLNSEAVEAERKSAPSDGERPAVGTGKRRSKA